MSFTDRHWKWFAIFDFVVGPTVLFLVVIPNRDYFMDLVFILIFITIGFVISVLLHELGHAFVGTLYGLKIEAFMFGPLQLDCTTGHIRRFPRPGFTAYVAAVAFEPSTKPLSQAIVEERRMLLAGPLTNLLLAGLLFAYTFTFYPNQLGAQWKFFAIAGLNILMAIDNLIPGKGRYLLTDGTKYFRLRQGGSIAQNEIRMLRLVVSTMKPIRPSAWPADFVVTATELLKEPNEHVGPLTKPVVALLLYDHLADQGYLAVALSWIEWTEAILEPSKEPHHKRFSDALIAVRARHYALWNNEPARAATVLCALPEKSWIREYTEWLMPTALIQLSLGDLGSARKTIEKARQRLKPLIDRVGSAQMEMEWLDIIEQRINEASSPTFSQPAPSVA
jgi:Zn-dependent protease